MRKITLVLATLLLGVTFATALEQVSELNSKDLRNSKRYRISQPILFVERSVEFLIFPNDLNIGSTSIILIGVSFEPRKTESMTFLSLA